MPATLIRALGSGLLAFALLAAGVAGPVHAAAPGDVYAWGEGGSGQLGNGALNDRSIPFPVTGMSAATAVAAGGAHSLALRADGTVWAWGYNLSGQIGDGTSGPGMNRSNPVQVSALSSVTAIAAGNEHSFALGADGRVWAWGYNIWGQLGDGTSNARSTPVLVSGLTGVKAIAAGGRQGFAVMADGTVRTWGYNPYGQLGDGSLNQRSTPVTVMGVTDVLAIAASSDHTLALTAAGTVWAWGANNVGQLGDGTTTPLSPPIPGRSQPALVPGLTGVIAIAANAVNGHSMALKADGTVWAWGYNASGQLGDGTMVNRTVPVKTGTLSEVMAIAAGSGGGPTATPGGHSLALKARGALWSWGFNGAGQLGDGSTTNRNTPVQVHYPSVLASARAISAGGGHNLLIGTTLPPPPPPPPLDRCQWAPWLCDFKPNLIKGAIELQCLMQGCVVVDLVPRNCLVKYDCPGCPPGAPGRNCPFQYNLFFDGLGDAWTVDVRDADGRPVEYTRGRTPTGIVLSFRPSSERYVEGKIGSYMLVFEMTSKGKIGAVYRVKSRLETGDRPSNVIPDLRR